ncbi:polysaccharide deacetylase family protein [Pseudoduganella albidiflava]|uniref:NodB homology domain-containing protein n=1 Tax=Pseudoduganella albidiflava TaxID=321983 RepID=A0A411X354_9BURK|nr:polysaccharide deacetylase family protein [Pseudoduganella albidiflava]QBI03295.1 hypothetical protein EYF70_22545 [Pseudoduganella albidiflava]GGY68003.1 hypothetical protein GCM10007387_57730 [Pseudoduganella albidiflava]
MSLGDFVRNAQILGLLDKTDKPDTSAYLPSGQPTTITRPVKRAGKVVALFSVATWGQNGGVPAVKENYSGYDASGNQLPVASITSQPNILKYVTAGNGNEEIILSAPGTNLLTTALDGRIGLWVYIENQPGYEPGGTLNGSIAIALKTSGAGFALQVGFNSNQLIEGWNFLSFVMEDPAAYVPGSGVSEDHPFGVSPTVFNGAEANIKALPIAGIKIALAGWTGATLYFDSLITDWKTEPQMVLGTDVTEDKLTSITLPLFAQYGWVGYTAAPKRVWEAPASKTVTDWSSGNALLKAAYDAGWDCTNHTTNHLANGTLTNPAEIAYEINAVNAYYRNQGMTRGGEFYCSPQSSTSRLAEKVIKNLGIKLQRHARKMNVAVTAFGVPNIHHVGASDIGNHTSSCVINVTGGVTSTVNGLQQFSKIKRVIDVIVRYGDTWFPFWHTISVVDTGSGEDLTGSTLAITRSAFEKSMAYIRALELEGKLRVCDGITGFYYGMDRK